MVGRKRKNIKHRLVNCQSDAFLYIHSVKNRKINWFCSSFVRLFKDCNNVKRQRAYVSLEELREKRF